ncbi:MAG: carbohydrate kinase [Actinomycetia bacterium]|nr:carbohydrate kinase [Actinomycetes bacterium]
MIICAGEALVDLVPDARPGGGPMNTAIAAARLGTPTAFLGRVSTDPFGDLIWRHLADSGVDLTIAQRGDEPTCLAIVEGDPPVFTFQGDGTADTMLEPPDLSTLGPGPHILHGGTLGLFRRPAATVLADVATTHDGLVSLDPNVRPQIIGSAGRPDWMTWFQRWLTNTGVLRASDADLDWIFPGRTPEQIATTLFDGGVRALIVTTSEGAIVHTPAGSASAPAQRVDVVDTVGAGDSFCGGVLVCLHDAGVRTNTALDDVLLDDWVGILDFAGRVAAVTVQRIGADPPSRTDLTR